MSQHHAMQIAFDGENEELHSAIDAFASVLGAMVEDTRDEVGAARLAAWQRHLLVLERPPDIAPDAVVDRRLWGAARGVAVNWIQEESAERERRNEELESMMWTLVKGLSETLKAEAASDSEAAGCVDRLRAAGTLSPDELRAAVTEAVVRLVEILERRRAEHDRLAASLAQRIHSLSSDLESARRAADIDPLTRVANRGAFDRELGRAVDLQALTRDATTLVLLDLDNFKRVNDEMGHRVGDEVLRAVANELVRTFPRRNDLVARYGGDEFAVLLMNADVKDAQRLFARLAERLGAAEIVPDSPVRMSVTAGIAALTPARTQQDLLEAADRALYRAKAAGRGCARVDTGDDVAPADAG